MSQSLQNSRVDFFSVRDIDFHGRQIKNAKNAVDEQDYVTLSQLHSVVSAATKVENVKPTISGQVKSPQPGAVLFVGADGTLSQDFTNFSYSAGKVTLSNTILLSSLTALRPVKTDVNKNLVTSLINLSSANDRTGVLNVANGGSGAATFTANAVLLGNGIGAFAVQVGVGGALTLTPTTGSPSSATSNFVTSVTDNTVTIQYKDWSGVNQTVTVVQTTTAPTTTALVTVGGTFLTAVTLTANAFTNGVRTT